MGSAPKEAKVPVGPKLEWLDEFQEQCPGWQVHFAADLLGMGEVIIRSLKLILIDRFSDDVDADARHAAAHVVLHEKHSSLGLRFTPEQCDEADEYVMLERSWAA